VLDLGNDNRVPSVISREHKEQFARNNYSRLGLMRESFVNWPIEVS
jgi:hypothetical protein